MEYEKITIGDKNFRLMPEEDYKSSTEQPKRARTGYERVKCDEWYYAKCNFGLTRETSWYSDEENFAKGDYVNEEQLFDDNEHAGEIYARMLQWQALNDDAVDIHNTSTLKYFIYYNAATKSLTIDSVAGKIGNHTIYFSIYSKAEEALEVFRDDLIWLHTKYRRRLDEPKRD